MQWQRSWMEEDNWSIVMLPINRAGMVSIQQIAWPNYVQEEELIYKSFWKGMNPQWKFQKF